jgi:outer membrane protein TolC
VKLTFTIASVPLAALTLGLSGLPALARAAEAGLTLEKVVSLAAQRNERAAQAEATADAARARVDRARAFFFPELSAGALYTRRLYESFRQVGGSTVTIQRKNALSAQANLLVPLIDARLIPIYRQAKLEGESARQQAENERRILGYEAADAFLGVLGQEQVLSAATRRVEFSLVTLREAKARAAAGLVSSNDVTRSELESATAERELSGAKAAVETARLALAYLVNADIGEAPLSPPEPLLAEAGRPTQAPDTLVSEGLEKRLDLTADRAREEAARVGADEPYLRFLPAIAGVAQYRVTNEQGLAGRTGDGSAGVSLTWPIWDGGERIADRKERLAITRAASATVSARTRQVALDVKEALVALASARATQASALRAAEVARRNVDETGQLYRQGLVRALEVADANLRLFEAEVALARERNALGLAYLDLKAATGALPPGLEGSR